MCETRGEGKRGSVGDHREQRRKKYMEERVKDRIKNHETRMMETTVSAIKIVW